VTDNLLRAGTEFYVSNMMERDIASNERDQLLATLSRGHRGAIVDVRIGGADEVVGQPFDGISADGKDLFVHLGSRPGKPHHGHRIPHVERLKLVETDDGGAAVIAMTSSDGTETRVTFRSPVREELLDPLVE
jgi:hypothetical protein